MRKYLAECIGTFILTLAVLFSLAGVIPVWVSTPLVAGLTLGFFVFLIGPVSGAHLNPAITLAVWTARKMDSGDVMPYVIMQFIGGGIGYWVSRMFSLTSVTFLPANGGLVFLGEALGAFFLSLGVASAVYERTPHFWRGIVVGGALWIGGWVGASLATGVVNPAVAFGLNAFTWMHAVGPIAGAILGMHAFRFISRSS